MPNLGGEIHLGIFSVDLRQFDQLQGVILALKGKINAPIANMLNELGFTWRDHVVPFLAKGMIMRSPRFIKSRMYVEKTPITTIDRMQTRVGSTLTRGKSGEVTFDGFAHLMGHDLGGRTRTLALIARGGDERAKAKASGKLMPDQDIPKPEDFEIAQPQSRVAAMIRIMGSTNVYGKKFIIPKGMGFAPGLYRIKSKKGYVSPTTGRIGPSIQIVQHFDRAPKVHRWMWLPESMKDMLRRAPIAMMWQQAVQRILTHKGK